MDSCSRRGTSDALSVGRRQISRMCWTFETRTSLSQTSNFSVTTKFGLSHEKFDVWPRRICFCGLEDTQSSMAFLSFCSYWPIKLFIGFITSKLMWAWNKGLCAVKGLSKNMNSVRLFLSREGGWVLPCMNHLYMCRPKHGELARRLFRQKTGKSFSLILVWNRVQF